MWAKTGWVVAIVFIAWACSPSDDSELGGTPEPVCTSADCGDAASAPPPCTPKGCDGANTRCGELPDGCGGTFQCTPCPSLEVCDDGKDNDADGASDCADTQCHADAACSQCKPVTCEALSATCGKNPDGCGGTVTCGTCTGPQVCGGEFTPRCAECQLPADLGTQVPLVHYGEPGRTIGGVMGRGWPEPDLRVENASYDTFRWTAPADGAYVFSNAGSGTNSVLFIRAGHCNGEPVPGTSAAYPHRYELKAGQTVYLSLFADNSMESRWASPRGYYRLSISRWVDHEGGRCGDGFDNDGDGHFDCFDPDCAGASACDSRRCAQVDLGAQLPVVGSGPRGQPRERFFPASCGWRNESHRYVWTAPKDGTFVIHTECVGATIALWSSCGGPELACASNPYTGWAPHTGIVRALQRGETVLISVEGTTTETAPRTDVPSKLYIHERAPEDTLEACSDDRDNDGDGRLDNREVDCKPFYPDQPYP